MTRVLYLVPRVDEKLPEVVRRVLARRRHATLTGRCACGAVRSDIEHMAHEDDCPATDDALIGLLSRHGIRPETLAYEAVLGELAS